MGCMQSKPAVPRRNANSSREMTKFKNPVHAQTQSHFVCMALELREQIYYFFLSPDAYDPSTFVTDYSGRRDPSTVVFSVDESLETPSNCVYYPLEPPPMPTTSLLLCCQLIHEELGSILERMLENKTFRYKLDCEIVNEQFIYPTWTLTPAYSLHIPHVDVTVRMSGECMRYRSAWNKGSPPGDMVWSFLSVLLRFLERGPHFLSPKPPSSATGLTISTLTVNFITPDLPSSDNWDPTKDYRTLPDTAIDKIRGPMNLLFNGTLRDYLSGYRRKVGEGVGMIRLCCDGEDRVVWGSQLVALRKEIMRINSAEIR